MMFTQHFGLKSNPFVKEIEHTALFASNDLRELSSRLDFVKGTRGFFLLTSEPGCGKTSVLRRFVDSLNPNLFKVCYSALASVTVMDFYRGLILRMGEEPAYKKVMMFEQLQRLVHTNFYEKRVTPIFILDEAHCLSNGILDDIQMIFNFKMDSDNPFILIFSGHNAIRARLHLGVHQSLRQRLIGNYHMTGLARGEMADYLASRLSFAGAADPGNLFTEAACESIYSCTNGIPRLVNNLATASLTCAFAGNRMAIDEETVYQAAKDIEI
jgi:type II secretory pathway predicted ATPase ExeA